MTPAFSWEQHTSTFPGSGPLQRFRVINNRSANQTSHTGMTDSSQARPSDQNVRSYGTAFDDWGTWTSGARADRTHQASADSGLRSSARTGSRCRQQTS